MNRIILLLIVPLLTGCSTFWVKREPVEIVPSRTNTVQVVTTNIITREVWTTNSVQIAPQRTNELGVVLPPVFSLQPVRDLVSTQTLQTNLQQIILPPVYYTNLSLGSGAATAITTAGDLAPVPWAGLAGQIATGAAGIAFGIVNLFAKRKALKEAGEAQRNAEDFKTATEVLVHNVETVRQEALKLPGYSPQVDKRVMAVITGVQKAADVAHIIAPIVEAKTGSTRADAAHAA
jgi:hypothetical protein